MALNSPQTEQRDTVVISFRAPRALVSQLDEIARGDQRTRANFIINTLTRAIIDPAKKYCYAA